MKLFNRRVWINFLSLLPSTAVTVFIIGVAFLRFYDQSDFEFLGVVTQPRVWSNRLTVAALVAALANFGVEWNRRNRETDRLARAENIRAEEKQRRAEEEQRRAEEEQRRVAQERAEAARRTEEEQRRTETREREARRVRIEAQCRIAQIRFQLESNEAHRQELINVLAVLEEYGNTL